MSSRSIHVVTMARFHYFYGWHIPSYIYTTSSLPIHSWINTQLFPHLGYYTWGCNEHGGVGIFFKLLCSFSLSKYPEGKLLAGIEVLGLPGAPVVKSPSVNAGKHKRCGFYPCVKKIPQRRAWQWIQISMSGEYP